jgi:transposase, IS5 family
MLCLTGLSSSIVLSFSFAMIVSSGAIGFENKIVGDQDPDGEARLDGDGRLDIQTTKAEGQTSLDALSSLIDWAPADRALAGLYPSAKGEKAWPPLAMFKALLLATWYDLSDVMLVEALSDRASFRRFCGFSRDEATPERTAFVRFRRLLVAQGLDRSLFAAIARDLESKGRRRAQGHASMRRWSARPAKATSRRAKHKSRPPAHGYKAHIAADKDTGIIHDVDTTAANEADVSIAPAIIPDAPGEVYADRAYYALSVERAIESKGATSKLMRKGHRWLAAATLEGHNRPLRPIRASIEKIFGTWKRSYHFRAMRWIGLGKARLQVHLAAIAYNVKRFWRLQAAWMDRVWAKSKAD